MSALLPHHLTIHVIGPRDAATASLLGLRNQLRGHVRASRREHLGAIQDGTTARLGWGSGVSLNMVILGPPTGDLVALLQSRTASGLFRLVVGYAEDTHFFLGGAASSRGGFLRPITGHKLEKALGTLGTAKALAEEKLLSDAMSRFFICEGDVADQMGARPMNFPPAPSFPPGKDGPEFRLDYS